MRLPHLSLQICGTGRTCGQLGLDVRASYCSDEQVPYNLLFKALRAIEDAAKGRGIQKFRVDHKEEREGRTLRLRHHRPDRTGADARQGPGLENAPYDRHAALMARDELLGNQLCD